MLPRGTDARKCEKPPVGGFSDEWVTIALDEWIGWSDDSSQLFFSNTHFVIYEGDWGKPYAARIEVWFVPDSGEDERKLIDRIFKIEGWQR